MFHYTLAAMLWVTSTHLNHFWCLPSLTNKQPRILSDHVLRKFDTQVTGQGLGSCARYGQKER